MVTLLRDFGSHGIFMNVCDVVTVAVVIPLRDFGLYGIIFMTVFTVLYFPVILDGRFTIIMIIIIIIILSLSGKRFDAASWTGKYDTCKAV
jgi:hypothetical protein